MKITLRKAAVLRDAALVASRQPLNKQVSVSIHSKTGIEASVVAAREALTRGILNASALIDAHFTIRRLLAERNLAVGIDKLVNEKNKLDADEKLLAPFVVQDDGDQFEDGAYTDLQEAQSAFNLAVERSKSTERGIYSRADSVKVRVLDAGGIDMISDRLAVIRRRKAAISDELLEANMVNTIELPDAVVSVLQGAKLI